LCLTVAVRIPAIARSKLDAKVLTGATVRNDAIGKVGNGRRVAIDSVFSNTKVDCVFIVASTSVGLAFTIAGTCLGISAASARIGATESTGLAITRRVLTCFR